MTGRGCWAGSLYGMKYGYRVPKYFRIFIEKGMVNYCLIVCKFGILCVFEI